MRWFAFIRIQMCVLFDLHTKYINRFLRFFPIITQWCWNIHHKVEVTLRHRWLKLDFVYCCCCCCYVWFCCFIRFYPKKRRTHLFLSLSRLFHYFINSNEWMLTLRVCMIGIVSISWDCLLHTHTFADCQCKCWCVANEKCKNRQNCLKKWQRVSFRTKWLWKFVDLLNSSVIPVIMCGQYSQNSSAHSRIKSSIFPSQ